jgi:magnesium chelatase family protein
LQVCAYALRGYEGCIVSIETDLRRGIPGTEIIGLPDSAVKEARERVRAAIKNSSYNFPRERLLINLTPAGIKKEGSHFDLAIALAILQASGDLNIEENFIQPVLALGELELSGRIRRVQGLLSAIGSALESDIRTFIVPYENRQEAEAIAPGRYWAVSSLQEACEALQTLSHGGKPPAYNNNTAGVTTQNAERSAEVDFKDIKGQPLLKRALEAAAAGRHNLFFFGPPGCGKTLSIRALQSILPPLSTEEQLETNRIYSIRGELTDKLLVYPPFRAPHHSSSSEGIIGGGRLVMPGEVSLAHNGVLFLDESFEFNKSLLQNLREPLENKKITLARAGQSVWYPAAFQLVLAANVCPCGNMGRSDRVCLCSPHEIGRYWKRLGGAVLDRIDIRLPAAPVAAELLLGDSEEPSSAVRARVMHVKAIQQQRYKDLPFKTNADISAAYLKEFCRLGEKEEQAFLLAVRKLDLSSRASHSILRVSRTLADMAGEDNIGVEHLLEAAGYRRYGDSDLYWTAI